MQLKKENGEVQNRFALTPSALELGSPPSSDLYALHALFSRSYWGLFESISSVMDE